MATGNLRIADYFYIVGAQQEDYLHDSYGPEGTNDRGDTKRTPVQSDDSEQHNVLPKQIDRKVQPRLLSKWPDAKNIEEAVIEERGEFPTYLPLFVFPRLLQVHVGVKRPRSTWHSFTLTNSSFEHTYGVCLMYYVPLATYVSDRLRQQCQERAGPKNHSSETTRMWVQLAIGLLGAQENFQTLWREWLKAVAASWLHDDEVKRTTGSIDWLPLERYVVNICGEVACPSLPGSEVGISVKQLKLYSKRDRSDEWPNWRDVDLYPLFRAVSVETVICLLEAMLAESRVIIRSSVPAMLQLVCRAIVHLIWPLKFNGLYIPLLPMELRSFLHAPTPYVIGILDDLPAPSEDVVVVDVDRDIISFDVQPPKFPHHPRRKLMALLNSSTESISGKGIPSYVTECFPSGSFPVNSSVFTFRGPQSTLMEYVRMPSNKYASPLLGQTSVPPVHNPFLTATRMARLKEDHPFLLLHRCSSADDTVGSKSSRKIHLPTTPPSNSLGFSNGKVCRICPGSIILLATG